MDMASGNFSSSGLMGQTTTSNITTANAIGSNASNSLPGNKETISMTLSTSLDAMFKRKRGRPPKNRVVEVSKFSYFTFIKKKPQALFREIGNILLLISSTIWDKMINLESYIFHTIKIQFWRKQKIVTKFSNHKSQIIDFLEVSFRRHHRTSDVFMFKVILCLWKS